MNAPNSPVAVQGQLNFTDLWAVPVEIQAQIQRINLAEMEWLNIDTVAHYKREWTTDTVQQAVVDLDLGWHLMTWTSADALVLELHKDVFAHPAHTTAKILEHLETSILCANEAVTKCSDLEPLCQLGGTSLKMLFLPIIIPFLAWLTKLKPLLSVLLMVKES